MIKKDVERKGVIVWVEMINIWYRKKRNKKRKVTTTTNWMNRKEKQAIITTQTAKTKLKVHVKKSVFEGSKHITKKGKITHNWKENREKK